jgi:tetratricopeptide (TPR) repeat protein
LLYNREKRFDDAIKVLAELRKRYPRNRLVLLEAGATATRGNRPQDAESLLTEGLSMLEHDTRPRIPGEEALWHYKRGAARVMLRRNADALADLRLAIEGGAPWVQGRSHLELARLAAQQGDHAAAEREASQASTICTAANDPICIAEAKKIR